MATAFEDALAQAMATGAMYFAENNEEFFGSQKTLVDHFRAPAADFAKWRPDLLEAIVAEGKR